MTGKSKQKASKSKSNGKTESPMSAQALQDALNEKIASIHLDSSCNEQLQQEKQKISAEANAARAELERLVAVLVSGDGESSGNARQQVTELFSRQCDQNAAARSQLVDITHQRDTAQATKVLMTKECSKLERLNKKLQELCRTLQDKNKTLMEEVERIRAEDAKCRLQLQQKFEGSISEVNEKIQSQEERFQKQEEDNTKLRESLGQYLKYEELREKEAKNRDEQRDAEKKLFAAHKAQLEKSLEIASVERTQLEHKLTSSLEAEINLRQQIAEYSKKFDDVHQTLNQSSKVFNQFKQTNEKMQRRIKQLENEQTSLKRKEHKSGLALVKLMEEKKDLRGKLTLLGKQKDQLSTLCRSLQNKNKDLSKKHLAEVAKLSSEPEGSHDQAACESDYDSEPLPELERDQ